MAIGDFVTMPSGERYVQVGEDEFELVNENQQVQQQRALQQPVQQTEQQQLTDANEVTAGEFVGGLGADIGISAAGNIAGAALAPYTFGLSYPVLSFASGVAGDLASQEIEGKDEYSWGRAIVGGFANMLPGAKAVKNAEKAAAKAGKVLSRGEKIAISAGAQAKRGAAIGGSQQAAIAVIDEGRAPTPEELAKGAFLGGAFGGIFGAGTQGVMNKIGGKTPKQIDRLVVNNEITGDDIARSTSFNEVPTLDERLKAENIVFGVKKKVEQEDNIQLLNILSSAGDDLTPFQKVVNAISPKKVLTREVADKIFYGNEEQRSLIVLASRLNKSVTDQIGENQQLRNAANYALRTGEIPEQIAGTRLAGDLKTFIDTSRKVEVQGLYALENYKFANLSAKEQKSHIKKLKAHIEEGEGIYTATRYRAFDDFDFKFDPKLRKEAIEELTQGYLEKSKKTSQEALNRKAVIEADTQSIIAKLRDPNLPKEEVAELTKLLKELSKEKVSGTKAITEKRARELATKDINRYVSTSAAARKAGGLVSYAPTGKQFEFKTDPSPAVRRFLGEITEPGEIIRGTLESQSRIILNNINDINIAKGMLKAGLGIRPQPGQVIDETNFTKLKLKGDVDTGVYVPNHVQHAISQTYLSGVNKELDNVVAQSADDIYRTLVSSSKAVKVLMNPPSYFTNAFGAISTLAAQGINPFSRAAWKGMKLASSEFQSVEKLIGGSDSLSRVKFNSDYADMVKYGLSSGNVIASDIIKGVDKGWFSGKAQKILDPLGKAYQVTDVGFRYAVWQKNISTINKFYPLMKEQDVKKLAAKITNDTYQNYEMQNPAIRLASRYGVMPQFVIFTTELIRNLYNQAKFAGQMMKGTFGEGLGAYGEKNVNAMRIEGAKRLAALTTVIVGAETARQTINANNEVTPEKEQALRETIVAPWDKQKSLLFTKDKDTGEYYYQNMSYLIPHTIVSEAINAGVSDQPLSNLTSMVADNFLGEGNFIVQSAMRAVNGFDKNGKEITRAEKQSAEYYMDKMTFFLDEAFKPGFAREYEKLIDAIGEAPDQTTKSVIQRQFGIRLNKMDIDKSATFKIKDTAKRANLEKSKYTSAVKYKNIDANERQRLYSEVNATNKAIKQELLQHYKNLRVLGYSENDAMQKMKDAGVSSKDILNLSKGVITDVDFNVQDGDGYSEITGSKEEKLASIRDLYKTDPILAKKYMRKLKAEIREDKLKITAKQKMFKNMSISDRADYIMQYPNEFKELRSKGLITKDLMTELRSRRFTIPRD